MGKEGRPGKVSKGVETGEESHERRWGQDTPLPAAATLLLSSSASEVLSVCIFVCISVLPVCVCKWSTCMT